MRVKLELGKVETYLERGIAFLEGDGAAKDYEQAFYWLNAACNLGSEKAEAIVREMRERSFGVPFSGDVSERSHDSFDPVYTSHSADTANGIDGHIINKRDARPANQGRCVACGMEALVASTDVAGAKYCLPSKGGCGTTQMIPIVENGLDRGLAMQPYRESIQGRSGTTYSSLGALLHMVKYDNRVDDAMKADIIAEIVARVNECGVVERLIGNTSQGMTIVPAPSSKRRKVQPVTLLAQLMSENRFGFDNVLTKRSNIESKSRASGTELAPGDVRCIGNVYGKTVLLVDDTYGEGATLRACIRALREKGARKIYFLSICKNIFGGMKGSSTDDDDIY